VLQGCFEVTLDETLVFSLVAGDAMTFASNRPHRWWNPGDEPTVVVWINTPPTF
jgi:quercetin dioxygenase-like cupin family protein